MSKLTRSLAAKLDEHIIENFADIYTLDEELTKIERKHGLDSPEVIAAIATCADIASAQQRLVAQPPAALVAGLTRARQGELRETARLMVEALLDGAQREVAKPPRPPGKETKPLPAFARPSRLPPVTEQTLRALAAAKPGEDPDVDGDPQLGRALVLGWLSHGADPKQVWGAWAAAYFPDDATARDLGMMARELGPRVGQFSKAQILVDVLAAMGTRAALEQLQMLATKVKTRSVKERAKAAFDATAKRTGLSGHDLADKLVDEREVGKGFVKRLEYRMVTGARMPVLELVENILQRPAVRNHARGVVFGVLTKAGMTPFTIEPDERLTDVDGEEVTPDPEAQIVVVHPIDLGAPAVKRWRARIAKQPFPQLDRPVHRFASQRALTKHVKGVAAALRDVPPGAFYGLEDRGWVRASQAGGQLTAMSRTLDQLTITVELTPGIPLGRGMTRRNQKVAAIELAGEGSLRARSELVYDLGLLASR